MRKPLKWFAKEMEKVLSDNDHKSGWDNCSTLWLLDRLHQEWLELYDAIKDDLRKYPLEDNLDSQKKIIKECCDVANFAMMIADNNKDNNEN